MNSTPRTAETQPGPGKQTSQTKEKKQKKQKKQGHKTRTPWTTTSHVADGELVETARKPGSLSGLLTGSGSQKRSGNAVYDEMKTAELTTLMRKLDDRERKFAMLATPLGIVLAVVLTIITVHNDPTGKGHESTSIIVLDGGISVAFAICLFATAWYRRRSLSAFALLFLGYSLGLIGIGIPFLFLGGYLLFRAWRIQKVLTSRGEPP